MRFVHTADWQIGMRADHAAARARDVREERLAAATRVVDAARKHDADFLVLAGDTFEDNAVDRVLVQRAADTLAAFGRPVFVLPGNHDPLVPGCVWDHPAWPRATNVTILRNAQPIAVPGGTLWPCPLLTKTGANDPTAAIAKRDDAHGIRVGLAHGSVEGIEVSDRYFPIPRDAAERRGVDYLALGHFHSFGTIGPRMAYSGSHEPTKFGERDSGNALLVEIDAPRATPRLTPLKTGRLIWVSRRETIRDAGDVARLSDALAALPDAERTLIDVALEGLRAGRDEMDRLRATVARFFHHRLDDSALRVPPDDVRAWIASLPAGAVRGAAERLHGRGDAVAERALVELFTLSGDGGAAR